MDDRGRERTGDKWRGWREDGEMPVRLIKSSEERHNGYNLVKRVLRDQRRGAEDLEDLVYANEQWPRRLKMQMQRTKPYEKLIIAIK